jgi:hypothetical protein
MLVLFLDIDGVLCSWQSIHLFSRMAERGIISGSTYWHLCPIAISNLNNLMEEYPQMKIVISSTRRRYNTLDELKRFFTETGFYYSDRFIGITPKQIDGRGNAINQWIKDCGEEVEEFVVIDDDSFDMQPVWDHFFNIDQRVGFDYYQYDKVVDYLTKKGWKPAKVTGTPAL